MKTQKQYAVSLADDSVIGTITLNYDDAELASAYGVCTAPTDWNLTYEECQNLIQGVIATVAAEVG